MTYTLGQLHSQVNPITAERALEVFLTKEGYTFNRSLFPFVQVKELSQGKWEVLSLYPKLLVDSKKLLGREFIFSFTSKESLKVTSVELGPVEEVLLNVADSKMRYDNSTLPVKIQYNRWIIQGDIVKKFKGGEEEIAYLLQNPDTTYLSYAYASLLYHQLGFPSKKFDNLGNFWTKIYGDLKTTVYRKIA